MFLIEIGKGKRHLIFQVPLEYCKFRKENGRIKGEVLSYENTSKRSR